MSQEGRITQSEPYLVTYAHACRCCRCRYCGASHPGSLPFLTAIPVAVSISRKCRVVHRSSRSSLRLRV